MRIQATIGAAFLLALCALLGACGVGGIAAAASGGGGGGGGSDNRKPKPPTAEVNRPVDLPASNFVTFTYLLRDPQVKRNAERPGGDTDPRVRVTPQFRVGLGPWIDMTEAQLAGTDGTRGVPLGQRTFIWNTIADLGADLFDVQIQVLAEYEPTAGFSRRFRVRGVEDAIFRIDNRLATTVFGQDVRPPDDIDTFPVDIVGVSDSFLVASIGAGIVERVDDSGRVLRVVGFGIPGNTGDGGRPDLARLQLLLGLATDAAGNIYTQHSTTLRVSNLSDAKLTLGSQELEARTIDTLPFVLTDSRGIAVHPSGVVLFLNAARFLIAFNSQDVSDPMSGSVTLAGTTIVPGGIGIISGAGASLADGVPAVDAGFREATLVEVGPDGEIYVGDRGSANIRVINSGMGDLTIGGRVVAGGTIDTVAGGGASIPGLGDGGPARGAVLGSFAGISVSPDRRLYIADTTNVRVAMANLGAADATFGAVTVPVGNIDTVVGGGDGGVGSPATQLQLNRPNTVAVDRDGHLLVGDETSVLLINGGDTGITSYGVSVSAGRSATAYEASNRGGVPLDTPRGMASRRLSDGNSVVYFCDQSAIRFLNLGSTSLASGAGSAPAGGVGIVGGGPAPGFSGDGGSARAASFADSSALALDGSNRLYVADTGNNRIRLVNVASALTVNTETVLGKMIVAGAVDTVIGGDSGPLPDDGDGMAAAKAVLRRPEGVAVGSDGLIYVADTANHRVRVVNPSTTDTVTVAGVSVPPGNIETIFGNGMPGGVPDGADLSATDTPTSVAVDNFGMVYVAEAGLAGTNAPRIRMINPTAGLLSVAGIDVPPSEVRTIVGDGTRGNGGDNLPATQAQVDQPTGLVVQSLLDPAPVALYFCDRAQHVVRMVNLTPNVDLVAAQRDDGLAGLTVPPASIVTIAGGPNDFQQDNLPGFSGDGMEAAEMRFNQPAGIALTTVSRTINGGVFTLPAHMFIADGRNGRIRRFGAPPIAIIQ